MNSEELAWAAGLFDGEGHIRCDYHDRTGRRSSQRTIQMEVGQCTSVVGEAPFVLMRFRNAIGMGKPLRVQRATDVHREKWALRLASFKQVHAAMALLWPWLSPVKKEQATRALAKWQALPVRFRRTA